MKLAYAKITPFLNSPPKSVRVILIFGPDAGLVHDRADKLAAKLSDDKDDPFATTVMSGSTLGSNSAKLMDEMAAMPMLGGRKMVRLHQAVDGNAGPIEDFIKAPCSGDSILIIEGGELQTRSKLRKVCEGKTETAAAVPCYFEDGPQRMRTIGALLHAENLNASHDILSVLAEILPPDRMAMNSELDKLALYVKGQKDISIDDIRAIIAKAGGAEMDELIEAIAGGNVARTGTLLDYLWAEQTSPVALLRAIQRHLMRLHVARSFVDKGENATMALKQLKPPVFWKQEKPMLRQLNRWTTPRLELRLHELREAEAACKKTGTPDIALCSQLFLNMSAKG